MGNGVATFETGWDYLEWDGELGSNFETGFEYLEQDGEQGSNFRKSGTGWDFSVIIVLSPTSLVWPGC